MKRHKIVESGGSLKVITESPEGNVYELEDDEQVIKWKDYFCEKLRDGQYLIELKNKEIILCECINTMISIKGLDISINLVDINKYAELPEVKEG